MKMASLSHERSRPVRNERVLDIAASAVIALAVIALRIGIVGNPHVHVDEEFYLLVGGRLWEGALPYIDIWDRKPVGLFLIYAMAALFGTGVVAYQVLAMLFVFATGLIVQAMARRFADRPSAVLAAVTYVLLLNLFEGMGGQAPVFYNLPVTTAAAFLMRLFARRHSVALGKLVGIGALAMLLMGIAIQIKYSVVGEAIAFGLLLQWLAWRRWGLVQALFSGLIWASIALAPTTAAFFFYWHLGAGDLFIHANFASTLQRGADPSIWVINRLISIVWVLAIPAVVGLLGGHWVRKKGLASLGAPYRRFVLIWNGAAWFSFLAFGTYFPHYALSLAAPTALLFGFASGIGLWARVVLVIAGGLISLDTVHRDVGSAGGDPVIAATLQAMGPSRNCPYMYEGSPILYHLGQYCLPTHYVFPYHLTITREHNALGIDADAELARILSRNPDFIVVRLPFSPEHSDKSDRMVVRALKERYRIVMATHQWRIYSVALFRLKPGYTPWPNAALPMERGRKIAPHLLFSGDFVMLGRTCRPHTLRSRLGPFAQSGLELRPSESEPPKFAPGSRYR